MSDNNYHKFGHEAMAAPWQVLVSGEEKAYAGQAAAAAFAEVDRIEGALSRFSDMSDVARINAVSAGTGVKVGVHAMECLKVAARVSKETGGAFDVTVGPLMAVWRNADKTPRTPTAEELAAARARVGMHLLEVDEPNMTVRVKADGVRVDLGGIGKGYGADCAADILREWGIERALVSAGTSTVLALDAPEGEKGWPLGVGGVGDEADAAYTLMLREGALSGSGLHVKGSHIMDPRTGRPVEGRLAAWSLCGSGAVADALSTSFMVMTEQEVEAYVKARAGTSAMLAVKKGAEVSRVRFGAWPGLE